MTSTTTHDATRSFTDLGVDADLADALADVGIHAPFPIQEITLPLALSGADVIGQARTGTGKTLAFGLPLIQGVEEPKRRFRRKSAPVQGLVIVPTRELCLQVRDDLAQASGRRGIEVVAAYGGRSIEPQMEALRAGAPVVVGTPGRLLDLVGRGALDLSDVGTLVLDEADEMLDLGFLPDVERLIEATPERRQTLLFSATMPAPVVGLARRYMRNPTFLRADVEETRIAPETRQHFFSCHRLDKPAVLARILQAPARGLCVVFVRTKRMADILANELRDRGIAAAPIHSDLRQDARERALSRFRQGKVDVLVATEVAARGLDIDDVTHVVNYDCPDDEKMYLHRIGRTGRAGAAGVAVTLAVWNELARLEMIKRALEIEDDTHEVFSTSDILDELFDLPPRAGERAEPTAADWQRAVARGQRDARRQPAAPGGEGGYGRAAAPDAPASTRGADAGGETPDARAAGWDADAATADADAATADTDAATADTDAATADTDAATADTASETADTASGAGARVRRRTRRRDTADTAPPSAGADVREDGEDPGATPDAVEDEAEAGRRRVRRRTRRAGGGRAGDASGGAGARRARERDEDGAGPSEDAGGRPERATRDSAERRGRRGERSGRGDGARSNGRRDARGGRDGGRSNGGRSDGGRAARRREGDRSNAGSGSRNGADASGRSGDNSRSSHGAGGDGGGERQRGDARKGRGSATRRSDSGSVRSGRGTRGRDAGAKARVAAPDRAAARGAGSPRLRRPLEVTHLP
jgi:superfamily II DNA/RNA helicase